MAKDPPPNPWETKEITRVWGNPYWSVDHHQVVRPDGTLGDFYVIPRPNCVKLLGLTSEGNIVMIGRWMLPTMMWSVELPGGLCPKGEDPREVARRELLAETGYIIPEGTELNHFGWGHILNGLFPSRWDVYVAFRVSRFEDATARALEHGTQAILELQPQDIINRIDRGDGITCSVDLAVLERVIRQLRLA